MNEGVRFASVEGYRRDLQALVPPPLLRVADPSSSSRCSLVAFLVEGV